MTLSEIFSLNNNCVIAEVRRSLFLHSPANDHLQRDILRQLNLLQLQFYSLVEESSTRNDFGELSYFQMESFFLKYNSVFLLCAYRRLLSKFTLRRSLSPISQPNQQQQREVSNNSRNSFEQIYLVYCDFITLKIIPQFENHAKNHLNLPVRVLSLSQISEIHSSSKVIFISKISPNFIGAENLKLDSISQLFKSKKCSVVLIGLLSNQTEPQQIDINQDFDDHFYIPYDYQNIPQIWEHVLQTWGKIISPSNLISQQTAQITPPTAWKNSHSTVFVDKNNALNNNIIGAKNQNQNLNNLQDSSNVHTIIQSKEAELAQQSNNYNNNNNSNVIPPPTNDNNSTTDSGKQVNSVQCLDPQQPQGTVYLCGSQSAILNLVLQNIKDFVSVKICEKPLRGLSKNDVLLWVYDESDKIDKINTEIKNLMTRGFRVVGLSLSKKENKKMALNTLVNFNVVRTKNELQLSQLVGYLVNLVASE